MTKAAITELRQLTRAAGFDLFGVVPVGPSQTFPQLVDWLEQGKHGAMEWMARPDAVAKRAEPQEILPQARNIITLAFRYTPGPIPEDWLNDPSRGIIARYALYDDYHLIIKKKLIALGRALEAEHGEFAWKAYVDTGPFLEREWAARAGLGFIGRNTNLIHYTLGSYLFLAELLVELDLPEYRQPAVGSCGRCTNCVDQCPTGAILDNRRLDSNRCISYLTIEHRGSIPEGLRPLMKNRIYGCDICQEVCPWNKKATAQPAQRKADFRLREELVAPHLRELLFFDQATYRQRFRKSPIRRAKREGFMRNVSVALGNWGSAEAVKLLKTIQKNDPSALVQEHVQWALRQCR